MKRERPRGPVHGYPCGPQSHVSVDHPSPPSVGGPEVEVRVLGPIEIVGAAKPFTRAWAIELIVYLVMHPRGASSEQWATALWPERIMAPASLHSTASAARRSLGVSTSGEDHLPRAHGRLSLNLSVASDWSRFSELSKEPDPGSWRQALLVIRGRPFDGLRAADWVLLRKGSRPTSRRSLSIWPSATPSSSRRRRERSGMVSPQGPPGEFLRRTALPAFASIGRSGRKSSRRRVGDDRARPAGRRGCGALDASIPRPTNSTDRCPDAPPRPPAVVGPWTPK